MKTFITGKPRSGKSTVLLKVIELLKAQGLKVGGFITPEIRERGKRIGFSIRDIYSQEEGLFTSKEIRSPLHLEAYGIDVVEFERIALKALDFALNKCDVVILDEVAPMEMKSPKFK